MSKLILAACVSALIGAVSLGHATAQTTGPAAQDSTKMGSPTEAPVKMKKKKMKKSSMSKPTIGNTGKAGGEGGSGR
jgi:hypothetical protein